MREDPNIKRELVVGLAIVMLAYSLAIGAYECYLGWKTIDLVIHYTDYRMQVSNSSRSIPVQELPGNVYKIMQIIGLTILFCGTMAVTASILVAVYPLYSNDENKFLLGAVISNIMALLIPIGACSYVTWAVYHLSSEEIKMWNSVDYDFIKYMWLMNDLTVGTVGPGLLWIMLRYVVHIT